MSKRDDTAFVREHEQEYRVIEDEVRKLFLRMSMERFQNTKPMVIWRCIIIAAKFYMEVKD